jgi:hypothetical protein
MTSECRLHTERQFLLTFRLICFSEWAETQGVARDPGANLRNRQIDRVHSGFVFWWSSVKVLARIPANLTESFHGSPQSFQANYGIVHRVGHDRFLPNPFKFIYHYTVRRYNRTIEYRLRVLHETNDSGWTIFCSEWGTASSGLTIYHAAPAKHTDRLIG